MQESPLRWVGRGRERIAFCFEPDLDLLEGAPDNAAADAESGQAAGERADGHGQRECRTRPCKLFGHGVLENAKHRVRLDPARERKRAHRANHRPAVESARPSYWPAAAWF